MREVMVGRARVAVLRTAAKSAVLREKSRAKDALCKIFRSFRHRYRPARSKRAQGPQSASILRLSRGCLVAVAWRRSSRLFRAKSCGNCRENLCSRAAEKGHEYNGPISPRPRAWSTQDERTSGRGYDRARRAALAN